MRRDPGRDSLDQVELVMLLEEEFGFDVGELGADRADLLLEIACLPYEARWAAPEPRAAWPTTVRVVGADRRRVLFATGRGMQVGVGCRGTDDVIDAVRVYPSLQRALFAFERRECPSR
jgi:hypothetical protein